MGKLCRFPMHYDEECDADIQELISSTPEKRRSARLRQLIRLGLAAEQGLGQPVKREMILTPSSEDPHEGKRRNRLRFAPPSD